MSELKPCPFCNGHAKINTKRESAGMDGSYVNWIIHCEKCGAMISCPADGFYGRKALTEDKAIERWNRRADRSLWFRIGEICVDESKGFISSGRAVEKIRELLREERREDGKD